MRTATLVISVLALLAAAASPAFGQAARVNKFAAEYMAMPLSKLRPKMGNDVPTRRRYVAEAIAAKGTKAWPLIKEALADEDWRVQCCAIESIVVMLEPHQAGSSPVARQAREALVKKMPGVLAALEACLGASEYWVRCRAAVAIGMFAEQGAPAAKALAKAAGDRMWWVREAAVEAIQKVTDDGKLLRAGARNAAGRPTTSFSVLRQCYLILKTRGMGDAGVAEAILFQLNNPGQGMYSGSVASALTMLAESGLKGEALLPLLGKVLTDPAYQAFDGDPRKAACKALAKLGPKARKALPALRASLAAEKQAVKDGKRKKSESIADLIESTIEAIE